MIGVRLLRQGIASGAAGVGGRRGVVSINGAAVSAD
jgi:hypothetical protein